MIMSQRQVMIGKACNTYTEFLSSVCRLGLNGSLMKEMASELADVGHAWRAIDA
jgi:hypothetical protein